jgi:hypothetical protein
MKDCRASSKTGRDGGDETIDPGAKALRFGRSRHDRSHALIQTKFYFPKGYFALGRFRLFVAGAPVSVHRNDN